MRVLFCALCLLLAIGTAMAGDPPQANPVQPPRTSCNLPSVAHNWDFSAGDQGFTHSPCDGTGGIPVWAFGTSTIPGAPGTVWGTVLGGSYPNNAGEGLHAPAFTVDNSSYLMEIYHYFDVETDFDGCNVKVNGTVVTPEGGYTGTISTSTTYYAYCVDMQLGWTGHDATWRTDCFDLSAYMGQGVDVEFDFGSDSSVTYNGWYISYVKVGGQGGTPAIPSTWGAIKSLYQ
jgi:bacillopeptidase F